MKKTLAIILSVLMLVAALPLSGMAAEVTYANPANAYAAYDKQAVADGADENLSYDQIAAVVLDYIDRQIAAKTADFDSFEVDALGQPISVELNIGSLDGILSYQQYLAQLGGDFAALDTTAISGLTRADGDINFIYAILQFVADNAATFGKVFQWEDGQTFDFGKVGEYIETLPADNEIRVFYNDYLIGNDIQQKFTDEIAREMNYTVAEGETFDDVINNGILGVVTDLFKDAGLLSDAAIANIKANFNLRTTDIYTLIKDFVGVLQSDNKVKIDTYYTFILDNYIRAALKIALGSQPVVGAAVADATAVTAEFKAIYKDFALLNELSGGTVYFKAADGSYYAFTVGDTDVTVVNALTWSDSIANFEPPVVNIYSKATGTPDKVINNLNCGIVQTYHPTSESFDLLVYSPYGQQLGEDVAITGTEVPAEFTALMTAENEKAVDEFFAIDVVQDGLVSEPQVITFVEIEEYAEALALPVAQSAAAQMGGTVNSVDVTLNYKGYTTDDEFIMQVTAAAKANVTANVMGFPVTTDIDVPAGFITNPVATIVVDRLSGSDDDILADALELLNFFDTDFAIDYSIIDFAGNYDAYNGVIGQVNHILCGLVKMIASDDGYNGLALVDGDNSNLTANIQKICDKFNGIMDTAKQFMDEQGFADFIAGTGVSDLFASEHGFNAGMVYNLDFSDVESLYVCLTEMVLDFIDDGTAGTVNDIHTAIEGLDTLDQFAVALTDYALDKAIPEIQSIVADVNTQYGTEFAFTYTNTHADAAAVTTDAEDIIMTKGANLALALIEFAVDDVANTLINDAISALNDKLALDFPNVAFEFGVAQGATWQATLGAIIDRIAELSNGILVAAGTIESDTALFDKLSIIGNAIIPFSTMFSNCSTASYACDFGKLADIVFDEVLDGNFDNFLALFEANDGTNKTGDLAKDVSVNYSLIKASDYIVDSFFPDTVQAELYTDSATVQAEFTSSASDNGIAERNMISANARKTHLVPGVLELIREAGIIPALVCAGCVHINTETVAATPASCLATGFAAGVRCTDCGKWISGHEEIAALGHSMVITSNTPATCTADGAVVSTCSRCTETTTVVLKATGHNWEWKTDKAATCGATGIQHQECKKCSSKQAVGTVIPVTGSHTYSAPVVTAATCTANGSSVTTCTVCGHAVTQVINATGHTDANGDYICDTCGAQLEKPAEKQTFIQKIQAFFQKIIDFFKNLFG